MAYKKPSTLSPAELEKIRAVMGDPVKWANIFLNTYDPVLKRETRWNARWYQVEMLRDEKTKKVYRAGRRTGKTETMVVDMLWRIFTKRNYRCLTITPYENQVRLQFQRIRELIDLSPMLKAEVKSMTKNPYQITLKNGSAVFGFTTGASSGNGAASVRGQKADWVFLDEVDRINTILLLAYIIIKYASGGRLYERKNNKNNCRDIWNDDGGWMDIAI